MFSAMLWMTERRLTQCKRLAQRHAPCGNLETGTKDSLNLNFMLLLCYSSCPFHSSNSGLIFRELGVGIRTMVTSCYSLLVSRSCWLHTLQPWAHHSQFHTVLTTRWVQVLWNISKGWLGFFSLHFKSLQKSGYLRCYHIPCKNMETTM